MRSTDRLLPDGDALDVLEIERVSESGLVADGDGATRRGLDRRLNDVALPVAFAGGNVAGQHEVRQRRHRDIVRATDAGFEHAAAPHRNAGRLRYVVHLLRLGEAADAPQLDIDDAARPHANRLLRVVRRADALVETDGRLQLC